MGFPTKNDHFGGVLGVPLFLETPIYIYMYIDERENLWSCESHASQHLKPSRIGTLLG